MHPAQKVVPVSGAQILEQSFEILSGGDQHALDVHLQQPP